MTEHELKCRDEYYDAVAAGLKPFELRLDDRGYAVGDTLLLRRTNADGYTGASMRRVVTYVLCGEPWLAPGYVALGLANEDALYRDNAELRAALAKRETELGAAVALIATLRETLQRERAIAASSAVLRKDFHAALTTIGGRLYTQGTGAKWQMDLLSFVRDARERLEARTDPASPPPPPEAPDVAP